MSIAALMGDALALIEHGKYTEAIPLLRRVLEVEPGNAGGHFWMAQSTYLTGGSVNAALCHFQAAEQGGFDGLQLSLNRGILHAECGNYTAALSDFQRAVREAPQDPLARKFLEQTLRNEAGIGSAPDFYYPPPHLPHLDAEWLETCSVPQSMQFMVDCLPTIHSLVKGWPTNQDLETLDVGTASAAGPALLARLFSGHFFGPRMRVDAMDLIRRYRAYALRAFPLVNYLCGDLFEWDRERRWDLVICSHTIEHLADPSALIQHCQQRARRWALFYAPFEERALIPGHLRSITREYVESFQPVSIEVLCSPGWRHPVDRTSKTVLFVLDGLGRSSS